MKIVKNCDPRKTEGHLKMTFTIYYAYENREISLARFFSALHKTHENREKMRPRLLQGSPKLYENRKKMRVR